MNGATRVLVLTTTFPRWANDADPPFVFELSKRLAATHRISVIAPHFPGSLTREGIGGLQVRRYRYFFSPWERLAYGSGGGILQRLRRQPAFWATVPFFVAFQALALVRMLRRGRVQVIHAHWLIPQGLIALVARSFCGLDVPVLCTAHGGDLYGLRGKGFEAIKRWVARRADAVTVVSRSMKSDVLRLGVASHRVHVLPMGTDLDWLFTPNETARCPDQVLFVGRLVEKKGARFLIDAWPAVVARRPRARLRIAGDGPEKADLQRRCRAHGVADSVRFLGAVPHDDLPPLYRSSEVFVLPSVVDAGGDQEGFGLVLVEALGCACGVVATDLPAVRDIVVDGKTGILVPMNDPPRLAEAILRLLDDRTLRTRLGLAGRRHVLAHFSWPRVAAGYESVIGTLAAEETG